MCGIAGFVGKGSRTDLLAMVDQLRHRGPDSEGFWWEEKKHVYLGHRRLAIIDLIDGHQPMWTADDKLGVVFNGEIYNHGQLRAELEAKGYVFATDHSDTEILLHGYREWQEKLPEHLNGMWAFVIYDTLRRQLFVSRDRFGKKPLYYTRQNGIFAFASELTSLMKHGSLTSTASQLSLKKYFAYGFIPAPSSRYERIYKLPGGCNLLLDCESLEYTLKRYWEFVLEPETDNTNIDSKKIDQYSDQLLELLRKSVQRRLQADVPLGIFLSGGIDSSAIAATAVGEHRLHRIKTFSIGFAQKTFDESYYAGKIAGLLSTDHYQHIFEEWIDEKSATEVIARLDEPMGDSSILPTYLLCRETRKRVTVALSGDGADELFAGYDPFRALRMAEIYDRITPKCLHEATRLLAGCLPVSLENMSFDFKIRRTLSGLSYPRSLWNPVWLGPLEPRELQAAFREPFDMEEVYSEAIEAWDSCASRDIVDKTLQFYTKLYLQDAILTKIDRASMMNSLEVRSPYLDIELVDFVRKMPTSMKYHNGQTKFILKKALSRLLPREIVKRKKKGFGIPLARLFKQGKMEIHPQAVSHGLAPDFVAEKITGHLQGRADNRLFLWNYWVSEHYEKNNHC